MIKSFTLVLLQLLVISSNVLLGQIKVISLPENQSGIFDPIYYNKNEFRNIELLSSGWKVYSENDNTKKISITVPAVFEGKESLVFEKEIILTNNQIQNSQIVLGFFGLNYAAEISVNGYSIYKHSGGAYPFEIALPKDILKENSTITIKVNSKLDSENSIPSVQRFLFPNLSGGIIRDVYIKTVSTLHIMYNSISYSFDQTLTKASANFKIGIGNTEFKNNSQSSNILVKINLFPPNSTTAQAKGDFAQVIYQENNEVVCKLELTNTQLWSPQTPNNYLCDVSLFLNGQIIDKTVNQIAFYQIKKDQNSFTINGNSFALKGTTYLLDETSLRRYNAFQKIKDDLTFIKNTGFNAVRLAKQYPNPYTIKLCQELGLLALIELPLNSIPEEILFHNDFRLNVNHLAKNFISNYSEYSNTFIVGIGSSFLSNSVITQNFIADLAEQVKAKGFFTYASFIGMQTSQIKNLDFYGTELFSLPINETKEQLQLGIDVLGKNSYFISEATYPNYKGNAGGYLIKNSSDAQAKYFGDMIDLSRQLNISGFFINTLFEYKGEFTSLYGGYSENNFYKFYILDPSHNTNSIGYKVIASKLSTNLKVTIPIGTNKDDSPMIFIIFALTLSIIMAVLINTKKKFREDCTRALLRPYNFFADVRDRRILSGIHTVILMLIQAGSVSLLFTIILYFLRTNILLEKILLSFGHHSLMKLISYLAWNPQICFLLLFSVVIIKFVLLSLMIKFASFFIKTRVEFSSIIYTVIWSYLPFTLLLLVELILFKLLVNGSYNTIIILFLIVFFLWIIQRTIKGIYVIFDVRAFYVYMYSFIFTVIIAGGILLKYQLSNSTIYYISNAVKQFNLMIF